MTGFGERYRLESFIDIIVTPDKIGGSFFVHSWSFECERPPESLIAEPSMFMEAIWVKFEGILCTQLQ